MTPVNKRADAGSNELFTPIAYIEAARAVMGAIDLDPASSTMAQQIVQAGAYFTADDDGMQYNWNGHVWLNPPNGSDLIGGFLRKLDHEYVSGRVTEAIVIVPADTAAPWFQHIERLAEKICFVSGCVHLWSPDGRAAPSVQNYAVLYFGRDGDLFEKVFRQFGFVR